MNIQLCSFGCYLNSYKRISKLSNKELLTWTYKLVICTELFHESSLPKQNLNCSHTCGRIRSSTLNATCDPNIDLQFATASSLVKLGNRNLLCSEAMLSLKEIKMAGSLLVQTEPLLLSNILIGSSVLTLETGNEVSCVTTFARFEKRSARVSRITLVRLASDHEFRAWRQMFSLFCDGADWNDATKNKYWWALKLWNVCHEM